MISTCSLPATDCEGAGADVSLHLSLFVSPRLIQGSCGLPCKRVVLVVTRHAAAAHPHLPLDFGLGDADRRLVSAAVSHLTQLFARTPARARAPAAAARAPAFRAQWLSTCFERIFSNLQTLPRHFSGCILV